MDEKGRRMDEMTNARSECEMKERESEREREKDKWRIYIYIYNIYIYISEYSGLFIAFHDIISLGIYDCDM